MSAFRGEADDTTFSVGSQIPAAEAVAVDKSLPNT